MSLDRPRVFIDVDEVLADFVDGACKVHNIRASDITPKWSPDVWDMATVMGISNREFWRPISRLGERFWTELEALPWWGEVIDIVSGYTKDWYLLTSPSIDTSCYTGKVKWIKQHFGHNFDRFFITRHKHLLSGAGRLLIDDNPKNIAEFSDGGGKGLLFPHVGNKEKSIHGMGREQILKYLRAQLQELLG